MSKDKSLQDNLQSIQDRDKAELNEEQKKELKDVIEKVFMQALLDKGKPKDILAKVLKDKDEFLGLFSPWHKKEGKDLIKEFENSINNPDSNNDFSWLDILDSDKRWSDFADKFKKEIEENKKKYTNMRYQIPTHFHGDIDKAVIFHCMENPRGYLGEWKDSEIDKEFQGETLNEFYLYSASKRKEKSKILKEIIRERYQLEKSSIEEDLKKEIINIIYSYEESALGREIEHMYKIDKKKEEFCNFDFENKGELSKTVLLKDYYYLKEYYSQLIQTNKKLDFKKLKNEKKAVKEIADKICNVEIYPFSCAQPNLGGNGIGRKILLNSDLSRLGAYIVLRRIYKYLNDKKEKPVIVFRKYDRVWEKLFNKIFEDAKIFEYKKVLELLEKGFFYCQTGSQGGGITNGNVISVPHYRTYLSMKDNAFKEISSLLPRIEVDKKR